MSKRHNFNQEVILNFKYIARGKDTWRLFKSICDQLGYVVRVTGGVFLTHEIDCSEDDFNLILELMR